MTTKVKQPLEDSQLTHVVDMPPLEVVTEGIPPQEHIGVPPVSRPEAPPVAPEHRRNWFAWALAGVIGFLVVVAGIFAVTQYSSTSTSDAHMGLTPQAWQEYRAGERASTTPFHLGLTLPAWQAFRAGERASEPVYSGPLRGAALPYIPNWSIPSIAAIPAISIPSIEAIPAMSIPAIASMSIPSIESIPAMSIPSIPSISIPSTPSTPATPATPSTPTIVDPVDPDDLDPVDPVDLVPVVPVDPDDLDPVDRVDPGDLDPAVPGHVTLDSGARPGPVIAWNRERGDVRDDLGRDAGGPHAGRPAPGVPSR